MFIYRDKYGILHAVGGRFIAEENAAGKPVVEIPGACEGGYPCVVGPSVVDYGNGEIYVGGNRTDGKPVAKCDSVTQTMVNQLIKAVKEAGL